MFETIPSTQGNSDFDTAQGVINGHFDELSESGTLATTVLARIDASAAGLEASQRGLVSTFTSSVRKHAHHIVMNADNDRTKGGEFDGTTATTNANTFHVEGKGTSGDVMIAAERADSFGTHELYHRRFQHTTPMKHVGSATESAPLVMGTVTVKNPIEALTVLETDRAAKFVSAEYRQYMQQLLAGMNETGTTLTQVREAINGHDLTLIDSRSGDIAIAA